MMTGWFLRALRRTFQGTWLYKYLRATPQIAYTETPLFAAPTDIPTTAAKFTVEKNRIIFDAKFAADNSGLMDILYLEYPNIILRPDVQFALPTDELVTRNIMRIVRNWFGPTNWAHHYGANIIRLNYEERKLLQILCIEIPDIGVDIDGMYEKYMRKSAAASDMPYFRLFDKPSRVYDGLCIKLDDAICDIRKRTSNVVCAVGAAIDYCAADDIPLYNGAQIIHALVAAPNCREYSLSFTDPQNIILHRWRKMPREDIYLISVNDVKGVESPIEGIAQLSGVAQTAALSPKALWEAAEHLWQEFRIRANPLFRECTIEAHMIPHNTGSDVYDTAILRISLPIAWRRGWRYKLTAEAPCIILRKK